MCNKIMVEDPWSLVDVPDYLKTKEMCKRDIQKDPYMLKSVPDQHKIQRCLNEV